MFKLDNNLLEELTLGALPPAEKNRMLQHIYETLEMRVGIKLAEQMSAEQLDTFERFVNGDIEFAKEFLNQIKPEWEQSEPYLKQLNGAKMAAEKAGRELNTNAVIAEFGALTWLETNFPDYKKVVASELENLKAEIKASAPQILAAATQTPEA